MRSLSMHKRHITSTLILCGLQVALAPGIAVASERIDSVPMYGHALEGSNQADAKIERLRDFGAAVAKRGCPKSGRVTNEPITNRHDARITDQIEKTVCPGLGIRYYVAYARTPPAKILDSVEIANRAVKLPLGLKFGMSRSDIERLLGSPHTSKPNSITYFAPEGEASGNDGITFIFEKDKLNSFGVAFHYE